jgi:hypothetical protein
MPVSAPLFRDPIHDGAADPTIVWNRQERCWWLVYTNRRADADGPGVAWVHGSDIGVASSLNGESWLYRGTLTGLEFEHGRNTFWAPEVIWHQGVYHMYVSYVHGVPTAWTGDRRIIHYASANLWEWEFEAMLDLSSRRVIDACIHPLPGGGWRMWYKDEDNHSYTYAADSIDLFQWKVVGPVITDCAHEGPNVFYWRGAYWMVTDPWNGLGVYRSEDCLSWTRQANILEQPGARPEDGAVGHHADVLVQGDQATIFYFTHPEVNGTAGEDFKWSYATRRTSLQAARLELEDGRLVCRRDAEFELDLLPGE